jgi:hypothetical protein
LTFGNAPIAVEIKCGVVSAVKSLPSPTACLKLGWRVRGTGYQIRGGVVQATRCHRVDGNTALKHPALGSLFCASELRQEAMLLAMPAAEFATVPVAGKDCVELEHADKAAEKTAMAVSRGRFNASTFHERSAMGCRVYVAWERLTSWPAGCEASGPLWRIARSSWTG